MCKSKDEGDLEVLDIHTFKLALQVVMTYYFPTARNAAMTFLL